MCVTLLGRPYDKIRKRRLSIFVTVSQKNVSQRGLGLHRPHDTRPGLKTILSQTCDKIVCTFQINFIFLLLYCYPSISFSLVFLMFWNLSVGLFFLLTRFLIVLQNGRSLVRSQMMSLEFFVDIILPLAL